MSAIQRLLRQVDVCDDLFVSSLLSSWVVDHKFTPGLSSL